jgi:sugar lactone lactonase YvrE
MQKIPSECLLEAGAVLGEGACWDSRKLLLYWLDILSCEVHILDPATGVDTVWKTPYHVTLVHPTTSGDLILGTRHGLARMNPATGEFLPLVDPEADIPGNRFNDGKPDPRGRLFAGSIAYDGQPGQANLWRFETDLSYTRVLGGVGNSNGLCWSPDEKTFYYVDTKLRRVDAFDYEAETGDLQNRRTVVTVPPEMGAPDGMTIDAEGCLWTALWNGHAVARWNPKTGELLAKVEAPCANVTCPTFGGPDLEVLFFTTAKKGRDEAEADGSGGAGDIYAARPGVTGLPGYLFGG